ncbi:hypothetical protein PHJA_001597300 [Phtheirospermum japonicum]|uniref:Uncharacterized protein n=1 Tax=Phtheirospermum japonicum TaxID=374723 RepID=A0A830C5Y1_9LAMI|nr:hypothetical protein PHJA_001597300 [Phtheirospermum japonicum]
MKVSRPLSPKNTGEYYFSAPTSPSHLSQIYNKGFDDLLADVDDCGLSSAVPFDWEEKPGTPKSPVRTDNCDDFAFDLSRNYDTASLSAEELFDGGVIKPLKPPPRLQFPPAAPNGENVVTSPRTSVSHTRKIIQGALFSPRHKNTKEADPFAAAAAAQRGPSNRRVVRSLSPSRDRRFSWKEEEKKNSTPTHTVCSALSAAAVEKGHKKWKLKDFFLFRSASEGRAADKDPLKKYTAALRWSSFRAVESSESGSGSRRRGPVSAHELHYTVNRAVSEDLKKKTFLPYKQGILGRLAFNPAVSSLANGFGFSRK